MQEGISWYPVTQFRRPAKGGLSMIYSGSGKLTFSHALGDELEDHRISFGDLDGKLCFAFVGKLADILGIERPGLLVRRRQVSDSVLRRHCKGLEPGTRLYFDFDPARAAFIESRPSY